MALVPRWETPGSIDSEWDNLYLGRFTMPGAVKVSVNWSKELDVKARRGRDGARVRDRGLLPHRVSISIRFTADESEELSDIMRYLLPKRGDARGPITISHPATDWYNVNEIELKDVDGPHVGDDGIGEVSISALEWIPEPKKRKPQPDPAQVGPYYVATGGIQRPQGIEGSAWYGAQPPSLEVDLESLVGQPDFINFAP